MNKKLHTITKELQYSFKELYFERLKHLLIFGSQARGDAVFGSDIDILVVLEGEVSPGKEIEKTGKITSEISLKYDVVISCTFISSERYNTEQSPLLLNIRREGVPV